QFMALCTREAGKTIPDGVAKVREAVDFLRYYAGQARTLFGAPEQLPGPTGESNTLQLGGRGLFVCISPWNFPLAIFTGQVAAALAAGNPVLAKPAEQTSLIAAQCVGFLHQAGVPRAVLQLLPGRGETVGSALTADARVRAVMFTGSTDVALIIARSLAGRLDPRGQPIPLIADTRGQNAMVVDSSALPEQVVLDVVQSAFDSAGQRCSALSVLCLQEELADRSQEMLIGAMRELSLGNPDRLATDVGPVIDAEARDGIESYIEATQKQGLRVFRLELPDDCRH